MKAEITIIAILICSVCFGQAERNTDILKAKTYNSTLVVQNYQDSSKPIRIGPCRATLDSTRLPLVVIDGVPQQYTVLKALDPNQVQSITILKD